MVALSTWYEGFARGLVSLHTPPLLGRTSRPLSPMIPTLARRSRKSNYSRTYRPPPGEGLVIPSFVLKPARPPRRPAARRCSTQPRDCLSGGGPAPSRGGLAWLEPCAYVRETGL